MKILHVIHGYFDECSGGAENYTRDLMAEQRRRGLEPMLLTGSMVPWPACGTEELEIDGVRVIRAHRNDYFFDHFAKAYHPGIEAIVRDTLVRERPDVVHVHHWIRLTSNLVEIAHALQIPTVVTLHDVYTSCPRVFRIHRDGAPCHRPLSVESCADCVPRFGHETTDEIAESIRLHADQARSELMHASAVLVAVPATAALLGQTTAIPADRFEIVPLGYRHRFEPAPPPRALPGPGEPFRFGYWGHLAPRKGTDVLVAAFAALCARGAPRPVELHLFGPADSDAFRTELAELAGGHTVVFHGAYEHPQLAAAGLHMAVFPTRCIETFGLVLDEARELGLPCIASDLGALPERIGAGGLLVPPGDAAALRDAMARVLAHPALRDELAARLGPRPATPAEHADAIARVYDAARSARPEGGPKVDPRRRTELILRQRESALGALHPGRGPS